MSFSVELYFRALCPSVSMHSQASQALFSPRDAVIIIVTKGDVWCNNSNLSWGFGQRHSGIFTSLVNHRLRAVCNWWLVRLFFIIASSPHQLITWQRGRVIESQIGSYKKKKNPLDERPQRVWAHHMWFIGVGWNVHLHRYKHLPHAVMCVLDILHNNKIWDSHFAIISAYVSILFLCRASGVALGMAVFVGESATLVHSGISYRLFDGFPWDFVQTFIFPRG